MHDDSHGELCVSSRGEVATALPVRVVTDGEGIILEITQKNHCLRNKSSHLNPIIKDPQRANTRDSSTCVTSFPVCGVQSDTRHGLSKQPREMTTLQLTWVESDTNICESLDDSRQPGDYPGCHSAYFKQESLTEVPGQAI